MKSKPIYSKNSIIKYTLIIIFLLSGRTIFSQTNTGVRGDSIAIAELKAMVNTMGGVKIWSQLNSVHFVHRWYYWNRDSYIENEILDLTGPRSLVTMKNETYSRLRAYSPEQKYWNVVNGKFAYASEQSFNNAMERAPYSLYRVASAIAIGDSNYMIKFGEEEFPGTRRIELYGPDDKLHGYIVLNANKEPLVWATNQYKYTFGPMAKFGNLYVPNWAMTANGAVTYEMISLTGNNEVLDIKIFIPPAKYIKDN